MSRVCGCQVTFATALWILSLIQFVCFVFCNESVPFQHQLHKCQQRNHCKLSTSTARTQRLCPPTTSVVSAQIPELNAQSCFTEPQSSFPEILFSSTSWWFGLPLTAATQERNLCCSRAPNTLTIVRFRAYFGTFSGHFQAERRQSGPRRERVVFGLRVATRFEQFQAPFWATSGLKRCVFRVKSTFSSGPGPPKQWPGEAHQGVPHWALPGHEWRQKCIFRHK